MSIGAGCYPNADALRHASSGSAGGGPGSGGGGGANGVGGHLGVGGVSGGGSGGGAGAISGSGGHPGTGGSVNGAGGNGGRGTGGNGMGGYVGAGLVLTPDATGWIDGSTNAYGVRGAWYGFSYGIGPNGDTAGGSCEMAGHLASTCSRFNVPSPTTVGFPNTGGRMCADGVAALVLPNLTTGLPDYGGMYGLAIGFDFNYDPTTMVKGKLNALAGAITGISFDIDVVPANGMRVQFVNPGTDFGPGGPAYWGGGSLGFPPSPVVAGTNRIHWTDVVGPYGLGFDPTQMVSMYFSVPTQSVSSDHFQFCISNVTLLKDVGPAGRTCTNPTFPDYCPAKGGAPANCWSTNVNCNTLTTCSGVSKACSGQAQTDFFNCATTLCVHCTDPFPQGCPALGAAIAQCWQAGIICSTIVHCAGFDFGCYDPTGNVDCLDQICL